jgi:hypothetical protein
MPITRRTLFAAVAASIATAAPTAAVAAGGPPLDLFDFFTGRSTGEGRFVSDLAGVDRRFTVDARGRIEDGDLILVEHITYEDGVKDTAVWRFTRAGSGYAGRRTGVDTLVPVTVKDGVVSMAYVAAVAGTDGSPVKLRFSDVLELTDERTLLNTAKVTWLGIPVGRVDVTFRKH